MHLSAASTHSPSSTTRTTMSAVLPSDIFTFDEGDDSVSPSNALFPPSLSFPGLDGLDALDNAYLSPNTLSPRSADHTHPSLSPPASGDSPSSSLSFATDEYLLNNSFGQDELDMLIFPEDSKPDMNLADALNVPIQSAFNASMAFDFRQTSPFESKPNLEQQQQQAPIPTAPMGTIQPAAFDGLLHQWRLDLSQSAQAAAWIQSQVPIPSRPMFQPQQQPQQQHQQQQQGKLKTKRNTPFKRFWVATDGYSRGSATCCCPGRDGRPAFSSTTSSPQCT